MILSEKQIEMYNNCIFLTESTPIHHHYRGINMRIDMTKDEYNEHKKYFDKAFKKVDENYDNMLKDCYKNHYLRMVNRGEGKSYEEFLKFVKLVDGGRIAISKDHRVLYIELCHKIVDFGSFISPFCAMFDYSIKNNSIIRLEFDFSD